MNHMTVWAESRPDNFTKKLFEISSSLRAKSSTVLVVIDLPAEQIRTALDYMVMRTIDAHTALESSIKQAEPAIILASETPVYNPDPEIKGRRIPARAMAARQLLKELKDEAAELNQFIQTMQIYLEHDGEIMAPSVELFVYFAQHHSRKIEQIAHTLDVNQSAQKQEKIAKLEIN